MRNKLPKPLPLAEILKTALKQPVIGPPVRPPEAGPKTSHEDPVIAELARQWPQIVGAKLAEKSRPRKIFARTLIVEVPSSSWANELHFLEKPILEKLKRTPQGQRLEGLRFQTATRSAGSMGLKTNPLKSLG